MKSLLKYIGSLVLGIALCVIAFSFLNAEKQIKYVSMTEIFEKIDSRLELEGQLSQFEKECNDQLQKMDDQIEQQEVDGADLAQINYLRNELNIQRESLSQEYANKRAVFEEEVWNEINSKVNEYGKLKGYKFILGATGDGAIMYADDAEDITKEVIQFINQK